MESLIESGEEWMQPLLDFRNHLSHLQDPAQKAKYRDHRRRDGRVYFKRDSNEIAWGQTRLKRGLPQKLLEELLKTQVEVQKHEPAINPKLLKLDSVVLLPHIGSATVEGRVAMGEKVIINIKTFVDGHTPPDRVIESMF